MIRVESRSLRALLWTRQGVSIAILSGLLTLSVCLTTPLAASDFEPKMILDVVHIQPFQLEESFRFDWRSEKPDVAVFLEVNNHEKIFPRSRSC